MNLLTMALGYDGKSNARTKRFRRGMEKDWNRKDEPIARILKGEFHKTSYRDDRYRLQKHKLLEDID